jgi:hypothetical protein
MGNWQHLIIFEIVIRKKKKYLGELKKRKDVIEATIINNKLNINKQVTNNSSKWLAKLNKLK